MQIGVSNLKYLFINSVCGIRSTGRICTDLAQQLESEGNECKIAYGRVEDVPEKFQKYAVRIGNDFDLKMHALQTRLFDTHGFGSKKATVEFLKWADEYDPDVLWLHNIHGYYINVEILFAWIKSRPDMQVKWTLHDCWAFTGHCVHFTMVKCTQWQTHCGYCSQLRRYPACYAKGNVRQNFDRKKAAFTGVKNMTLITPSKWLADLVKQSFLKEYPVKVRYNTIDTMVFKPTPSDFRERYGLQDKKVVLGVASVWEDRKGLGDFIKLAEMLDDSYAIVLVGLTEKQIKQMPKKIKGITRTNDATELAAIYTSADVFANPSVEETFGMTTAEAHACNTKSIVYQGTACEEVAAKLGSIAVPANVMALYEAITGKKCTRGGGKNTHKCSCIICIPRTNSAQELAAIYTAADIFANPTYEDNYPTVNLEAQACGTRVITYATGGARETIGGFSCHAIDIGNIEEAFQLINERS